MSVVTVIPATRPFEGAGEAEAVKPAAVPGREIVTPGVAVIPATRRSVQGGDQFRKQENLRVAAYCRVSTGDESQQTSYTNQRAFYSGIIQSRPGWSFVGIYADEAKSGTNRIHRKEFNRMIEDAKAGKIDYIMTKSISRFARNTIDTLDCVRQLRQLSPPVGIVFEKENIDTLNATGELILTILSALAQDESRSLSDNIRWTFQKKFQAGKPQINLKRMLGYDKGEHGEWVINEEQASVVRFIFKRYVYGDSANKIAKMANEAGMRTVNGNPWRADSVLDILRNEKYVGDLEMQKTVTKDFLTHKASPNRGEAPKYYVKDHHAGIVDRFTWEKAQQLLRSKSEQRTAPKKRGTAISPFINLICGAEVAGRECGESFFRLTYYGTAAGYSDERSNGFDPGTETETYSFQYPVWRCRRKQGEKSIPTPKGAHPNPKSACPSTLLQECALEQSFMEMLYALKRDYMARREGSYLATEFKKAYEAADKRLSKNSASRQRMELLDGQIMELEQSYHQVLSQQAQAIRDAALGKPEGANAAPAGGEGTLRAGEMPACGGFAVGGTEARWVYVGSGAERSVGERNMTERSVAERGEAAIYADLARDLKERLEDYKKERATLEAEQSQTAAMKRNYDFFLRCLVELPEENPAGMRMNVNGLDVEGGALRGQYGKDGAGSQGAGSQSAAGTGRGQEAMEEQEKMIQEVAQERIQEAAGEMAEELSQEMQKEMPQEVSREVAEEMTGEMIEEAPRERTQEVAGEMPEAIMREVPQEAAQELLGLPVQEAKAPDYLRFERGMYVAFIKTGKVYGDIVQYMTNFGVRLVSTGNSRTLSSFLGFRRCGEDGTVEFLDEVWKVNGKSVTYRRKKRKRRRKVR